MNTGSIKLSLWSAGAHSCSYRSEMGGYELWVPRDGDAIFKGRDIPKVIEITIWVDTPKTEDVPA